MIKRHIVMFVVAFVIATVVCISASAQSDESPYQTDAFSRYGLELRSHTEGLITVTNELAVTLGVPENIYLSVRIDHSSGKALSSNNSFARGTDVYALFPEAGEYTLCIFAGTSSYPYADHETVLKYRVRSLGPLAKVKDPLPVKVHPNGRVANIQIDAEKYRNFVVPERIELYYLTKHLYYYFRDDFDFILFAHNENNSSQAEKLAKPADVERFVGLVGGFYYHTKNDTEGITPGGDAGFVDNSKLAGSKKRLQGVIHFPVRSSLTGVGAHEIGHRWVNYLRAFVPSSHGWFSSAGGVLGGFDLESLESLGDGKYRAGIANRNSFNINSNRQVPYSNYELYLMGLIPAKEFEDLHVAKNPEWVDQATGTFRADGFDIYSIQQIIRKYGKRVPDFKRSQKKFRALYVIISTGPLDYGEWTEADRVVANFSYAGPDESSDYNFWEATGGRATIQFDNLYDSLQVDPNDVTIENN